MAEEHIRLAELRQNLNINEKREKVNELKQRLKDESLWSNWEEGQKISQELAGLVKEIEEFELIELYLEEKDIKTFENEIKKLEFKTYLSGKHDKNNAILSIHAGQGGTEAMDWTEMLLRMYLRYIERQNWSSEIINKTDGDEAGLKTVTVEAAGKYAYRFLKN